MFGRSREPTVDQRVRAVQMQKAAEGRGMKDPWQQHSVGGVFVFAMVVALAVIALTMLWIINH